MPWSDVFRILERLPPAVAAVFVLLILLGIGFIVLAGLAFNIYKFHQSRIDSHRAHRERQAITEAAHCNMTQRDVEELRAAVSLQQVDVAARESSDQRIIEGMGRLETAVTTLTSTLNRYAERLIDWMARQRRD